MLQKYSHLLLLPRLLPFFLLCYFYILIYLSICVLIRLFFPPSVVEFGF
jgi:hypothetical protein